MAVVVVVHLELTASTAALAVVAVKTNQVIEQAELVLLDRAQTAEPVTARARQVRVVVAVVLAQRDQTERLGWQAMAEMAPAPQLLDLQLPVQVAVAEDMTHAQRLLPLLEELAEVARVEVEPRSAAILTALQAQ
jgi:hypothetical protein